MGNCTNFCYVKEEPINLNKVKMEEIDQIYNNKRKSLSKNDLSNHVSINLDKDKSKNNYVEEISDAKIQEQIKNSFEKKEQNRIKQININSNSSFQKEKSISSFKIYEKNELVAETLGVFTRKQLPPINLEDGAIFKGEWKNGLRDGKGIQNWKDNSKYEGEWKEDKANGFGKLTHADGDIYEGEWVNDKAHGKGFYIHSNGARYEGKIYYKIKMRTFNNNYKDFGLMINNVEKV